MNRLILIRHAQSEHHVQGLTGGWTDTPLTDFGHAQARALAARCRELFSETPALPIYSSDLQRAAQTAGHIAAALGTVVRLDAGLRETNNGIAAGMTWEEAKKIELPRTEPNFDWVPHPEAESWTMFTVRVEAALERISDAGPAAAIIVTHGGTSGVVIPWWFRLDMRSRPGISFEMQPASISELTTNGQHERALIKMNDTGHLDGLVPD